MAINLGSTSISNAYLGSTGVTAIYLGSTEVWTSAGPIPIGADTFKLGGLGGTLTSSSLASKLTGETLTYYVSQSGDIFVSSSTNYTINSSAFQSNTSITSYIDGGRCTAINNNAFQFSTIISASFPTVTSLGGSTFKNSDITYARFPKLTSISSDSFSGTPLITADEIMFPSASAISFNAFLDCALLVSASFPKVTTVGDFAFFNCTNLSYVSLPSLSGNGAIGGTEDVSSVFDYTMNNGHISVPSYYSQSNAGGVNGTLNYLSSSAGWTVSWL